MRHRLAASDARSERQQPAQPAQQPPDRMLQHDASGLYDFDDDDGEAALPVLQSEEQEDVSPVRDHPLAAGMRQRRQWRGRAGSARNAAQTKQPAERQTPGGGRALQELPLPPRNSGAASSPAPQRHAQPAQAGAAAAAQPAAQSAADAGTELGRGFSDLTYMRQYAVEASKALDGLRTQRRRTPAKGPRPLTIGAAGGSPGDATAARGRSPKQVATAAAARATIERFKQQLARPPGRTLPRAGRNGAAQEEPAALDDAEAAEPQSAAAAAASGRTRCSHDASPDALRQRSSWEDGGGGTARKSLVPDSPAFSVSQLSGSQLLSPAGQQRWRLPSGGTPTRPTSSDPSPSQRPRGRRERTPSPRQRQRRRLSVGALSDDWLEDPSDAEEDLLAADDFLAQSPLQSPTSEGEHGDMTEDRLFALARGSGGLRRCSSGALGLAGIEGFGSLTGKSLWP